MEPIVMAGLAIMVALGIGLGVERWHFRSPSLSEKGDGDQEDDGPLRFVLVSVERHYVPGRTMMKVGEKLSYVVVFRDQRGEVYRVRVEASTVTGAPLECLDAETGMHLHEAFPYEVWKPLGQRAEGVVRMKSWESVEASSLMSPTGYACASCDWRDGVPKDDGVGGKSCPWCDSLVLPPDVTREVV